MIFGTVTLAVLFWGLLFALHIRRDGLDSKTPAANSVTTGEASQQVSAQNSAAQQAAAETDTPTPSVAIPSTKKFVGCDYVTIDPLPMVIIYKSTMDKGSVKEFPGNYGMKKVCDDGSQEVLAEPTPGEKWVGTYVTPATNTYENNVVQQYPSSVCASMAASGSTASSTYMTYCR